MGVGEALAFSSPFAPFFCTGFVTEYGVIFVGMAYPVYGSVRALETMPLNARPLPRTPGPAGAKVCALASGSHIMIQGILAGRLRVCFRSFNK